MNRGVIDESLRRGILRSAKGSLNSPAIRFAREKSGFYLGGTNNVVLGINKLRVIDATLNDVAIRSNSAGAGNVRPLAVIRANATTANNQETSVDVYETAVPVGRISAYRQSVTKWGWKFYGYDAVLHATPAMTISGDKLVTLAGDLSVNGAVGAAGINSTTAVTGVSGAFTGAVTAATLATTGAITTATTLTATGTITAGALSTAGALNAATIAASGAITGASATMSGAVNGGSGTLTGVGKVGQLGVNTPSGTLPAIATIQGSFNGDGISMNSGLAGALGIDMNNSTAPGGAVTARGYLAYNARSSGFIGALNDLMLYTSGASAGQLILGTASTPRMVFDTAGYVSVHSSLYPNIKFAIKQAYDNVGGGFRFYTNASDAVFGDLYSDPTGHIYIRHHNNQYTVFDVAGHIYPNVTAQCDLGTVSAAWRYFYASALSIQVGTTPSYLIHLGADSAGKPSTSTWSVISDSRSKRPESITDFRDGLAVLKKMRPVLYTYNGNYATPEGHRNVGFVAEELRQVAPKMVRTFRGQEQPGDEQTDYLSVDLHAMPFLLRNAVLELARRIEKLEERPE